MGDDLKTRVAMNLVLKPPIVGTFVGGVGLLTLAVFWTNPVVICLGALALTGSGVAVAYRFIFKRDEVRAEVIQEMTGQTRQTRDQTLDDLYHRLNGDNDPHTEVQLNALRRLDDEFGPDKPWVQALDAFSSMKIREGVNELFTRSIRLLEESLKLHHAARELPVGASDELLKTRSDFLDEVDKNIESLTRTLAGLHRLNVAQLQTEQHDSLRRELEDNLDTALQADALSRGGRVVAFDKRDRS